MADIVKSATVTFEEDSQIEVVASNEGGLAILNAIVVTELKPVYGEAEDDNNNDSQSGYSYTDTGLKGGTFYSYKVAAIVDGKRALAVLLLQFRQQ